MNEQDVYNRIEDIINKVPEEDKRVLMQILRELSETGTSSTYENVWLADYKEIPVSIDTFIESDLYLGRTNRQGAAVYPDWRKTLREIFEEDNKYQEIVLTGATRIGKTSTAITGLAYMLYRLMCLRDPQEFFGKKEISKFSMLFFNVTKDLAAGVAFREFNDTIAESPWFMQHGTLSKSEKNFYYIPEGGKITIDFGSDSSHGLGKQVFCALMDEANFSKAGVKDVNKAKEHMQNVYNTISARIKGTFRKHGEVYGKLFAVSSKNSDSDFMEVYVQNQLRAGAGDHMYVFDKPQWEVLPPEMFSPEKFSIAIGDRYKKGFVLSDRENNDITKSDLIKQGYRILEAPVDVRKDFVADFDIALRDIAGISIPGTLSFINQQSITDCLDPTLHNPFSSDVLTIGCQDTLKIQDFYDDLVVDPSLKTCPIFIHLDLSLNTDRTGIGAVGLSGQKQVNVDGRNVILPLLTHLFSVAIQAPRGDKIAYSKIVEFLCWLRTKHYRIVIISRDQFQSEYVGQILEAQGFTVNKISLDRTPDGYMALRSVLLEKRIRMLDIELLQTELINLQRDAVSGKIDHTISFTKDMSDGFAGAVWDAILYKQSMIDPKMVASVFSSTNGRVGGKGPASKNSHAIII